MTIRWEYDNEELLENQVVQLISLTIDGNLFSVPDGCLPEALLPDGVQPGPCMEVEQRDLRFPFNGPMMFWLMGDDGNGRRVVKIVRLMQEGMSFILDVRELSDPGYPRIPLKPYSFERVFGIYEPSLDDPSEDGVIDQLGNDSRLSRVFPPAEPFFLWSWDADGRPCRGETPCPEGTLGFGARKGGGFPLLSPEFKQSSAYRNPDGTLNFDNFTEPKTFADVILFAATIFVSGAVTETVKSGDGSDVEVITPGLSSSLEPVFVQIDVRSTDTTPVKLFISDIHVGNIPQGLVLSTFHGHISPRIAPTLGEFGIVITSNNSPGTFLSSGEVNGALTGFDVAGDPLPPAQAVINLSWTNVPVFPDNDIGGLLATFPQPD